MRNSNVNGDEAGSRMFEKFSHPVNVSRTVSGVADAVTVRESRWEDGKAISSMLNMGEHDLISVKVNVSLLNSQGNLRLERF